ncbi:MAG: pectinesterase family protein [Saprospiraceae bacterium]
MASLILTILSHQGVTAGSNFQTEKYDFIVAYDGSGDFTKVQDAINAVQFERKRTYIFIKNGIYKEKLVLPASITNAELCR